MRRWKTVLALALVVVPLGAGISATAQAQEPWQRDRWEQPRYGEEHRYREEHRYGMDGRDWVAQFERRLNRVAMRIDEAARHGELSPREVRRLSWQRDRLISREQQAIADRQLTPYERQELDQRLFALAHELRIDVADAW
jgi:hypothetical protein